MALKSKNKINATFSMSSMTDIVFLLLIFFMLTSSIIPDVLNINRPTSNVSNIQPTSIKVTVSKDLIYMVGAKEVPRSGIKKELQTALADLEKDDRIVVIDMDKDVIVDELVFIASIAVELDAKVSIATEED